VVALELQLVEHVELVIGGVGAGDGPLGRQRLREPLVGQRGPTRLDQHHGHVLDRVRIEVQGRADRGQLGHRLVVAAGQEQPLGVTGPDRPGVGRIRRGQAHRPRRQRQRGVAFLHAVHDLGGQMQRVAGILGIGQPLLVDRRHQLGRDRARIVRPGSRLGQLGQVIDGQQFGHGPP
jgi:hypothetical protein